MVKAVEVDIGSVFPDPANAMKHDDKNLSAIKGSLARFGQQKPIVVDKNMVVRAGNGTLEAAKSLGWKKIWVVKSKLEGSEMTAYALADNRTAQLAAWDDEILGKTLQSLRELDFPLVDIGFDIGVLDHLYDEPEELTKDYPKHSEVVERIEGGGDVVDDPSSEWEGMPEFNQEDKTAVKRLIVNFKSIEDVRAFAELIEQKITDKTRSLWFPKAEIERCMDKRYASEP